MAKITKNQFTQNLRGKSIDVDEAKQDPKLADVNLERADLNNDGKIDSSAEHQALFKEVDRFDRDGSYGSMQMHNADGSQNVVGQKVEAIADRAQAANLRILAMTGRLEPGQQSNDEIMLVGMNKHSQHEVNKLRGRGNKVTYVKDAAEDDTIRVGGQKYDLKTDAGIDGFVNTLGLPADQSQKIGEAIKGFGDDARDEAAQIAQVWAKAEKGGEIPSRLVLSGHSVGSGIWGDDNGYLKQKDIGKLAEAMPKAARQVEDVHLAACYSGGKSEMEEWKAIFPKTKTIWAYTGSAPGSYSGATAHQARWDTATRGDAESIDRNVIANRGIRKGDNVAVWSETAGYNDGETVRTPVSTMQARVDQGQNAYDQFFSGERSVQDTQSGPLRSHYNNIQSLRQHPDLPADQRAPIDAMRDSTIRLIYFDKHVKHKFQDHHADKIQAGYSAMGMTAPDFSALSRKDAMEQISAFESAVNANPNAPQAAQDLLPHLTSGLRDLSAAYIPETWI
jgi:hypothetical protein